MKTEHIKKTGQIVKKGQMRKLQGGGLNGANYQERANKANLSWGQSGQKFSRGGIAPFAP